jgi:VWFA-related protein
MRRVLGFLFMLTAAAPARAAGQSDAVQAPTFRSGVDVTMIDVSVLDRDRRPITGLTAGDFTVLVDGQPRPVVSLKAVELAPPARPAAAWVRDVAPDVVANTHPSGRLIAILIDDASMEEDGDQRAVKKTRDVAKAAIDALGPDDLAAVLFAKNAHSSQEFTTDRRSLRAAVDEAPLFAAVKDPPPGFKELQQNGDCYCRLCPLQALGRLADALRSLPGERKIVLYISIGPVVANPAFFMNADFRLDDRVTYNCMIQKQELINDAFAKAALANVTIDTVDSRGFVVGQIGGSALGAEASTSMLLNPDTMRVDALRAIAENTGGRAVVHDNDMDAAVPALLDESSSYYLLGVDTGTPRDDGHFHPIKVQVRRPGAEVRARSGFYAPTAKERTAMTLAAGSDGAALDAAIDRVVPKADVPLAASTAPFLGADSKPFLAIVLGIAEPGSLASTGIRRERVLVTARAFGPEDGKEKGSAGGALDLTVNPRADQRAAYEVLLKMPLAPGRYALRMGAQIGDVTGSVFPAVDVPDFVRAPLSLSGLVVAASPSPTAAPSDAFAGIIPFVPTARRAFSLVDDVSTLVRVYEGGTKPVVPVTVTARIVDAHDVEARSKTTRLDATAFGDGRAADYRFTVPVDELPPGDYLLTITAAAGSTTSARTMTFTVTP